MAQDEKIIFDVQINFAALSKETDAVKGKLNQLKINADVLREALQQATKAGNVQEIKNINVAIFENTAKTNDLKKEQKALENQSVNLASANRAQLGSISELRKSLSFLTKEYVDLSKAERESEGGKAQLKTLKSTQEELKKLEGAYGDNRRSVGGYTEGILAAGAASGKFGGSLSGVGAAFESVRAGASAIGQSFTVIKSSANNVSETFSGLKNTAKEASASFKAGDVSEGLSKVGSAGAKAFKGIGTAIAASGIGLILIGVALLINYMKQLDPVVEKVEQVMAGVGAAIDVVGKAILNIGEFFKHPLEFIKQYSKEIDNAAGAAAALTAARQRLEDQERNSLSTQGDLRREAEALRITESDRTKSAAERIAASDKAGTVEKKLLEEQLKLIKKKADLDSQEVADAIVRLGTYANIDDALKVKQIKSAEELADIKAKIVNKDAENIANSSKIRNQDAKERVDALKASLQEDLRIQEFYGGQTLELKKRIAKAELESVLNDTNAGGEAKNTAQKKYNNDLIILQGEFDKNMFDLRAAATAKLFATQQQNRDEEFSFAQRRQDALLDIEKSGAGKGIEQQYILRLSEINAGVLNESNVKEKARQDELLKSERATNAELELLAKDTLFKAKSAEDQQAVINEIIQQGKDKELEINSVTEIEKKAIIDRGAKDIADATDKNNQDRIQKLIDGKQAEIDALGGDKGQAKLDAQSAQLKLQEDAEVASAETTGADVTLIHEKYANKRLEIQKSTERQQLEATSQTLGSAAALFKKDTAAYKALMSAKIIIDTYVGAQAAFDAVVGIPVVGPTLAPIAAGVAVAGGLLNLAKVNSVEFATGGYTGDGTPGKDDRMIAVSGQEYVLNPNAVRSIGINNLNHLNFNKYPARFASGGFVPSAGFVSNSISQPVFEQLQMERLIEQVASIPRTAVIIEDINYVNTNKARVDLGANV